MKAPPRPNLETLDHWPSWLNARGHLDRSACFELKVSEVRRLAGCVPMKTGPTGKVYRAKGRDKYPEPDLPNGQAMGNGKGRLSAGWWDIDAWQMQYVLDGRPPRGLGGDWRTGRAPAMRNRAGEAMGPEQGGYGPGQRGYELNTARHPPPAPPSREGSLQAALHHADGLDAGLGGNPNRGATREKRFGLSDQWTQRLGLEKWEHNSVSGVQYFLVCPGPGASDPGRRPASACDAKGLKGMTGTTSNCGDGSRGAHGKGWVCGQRVYKLFWVLARPGEVRDALLAERWIEGLTSAQLAQHSAAVSALIDRYGPVMGDDRLLRCRRCLRLRYGQSPEVLRRKRAKRVRG